MIRAGIIGQPDIQESTIKDISSVKDYDVAGIFSDDWSLKSENQVLDHKLFKRPEELISASDAIIVTGQSGKYEKIIQQALKKSRHVLIFPDSSLSKFQLENFEKLAEEAGVFLLLYHKKLNIQIPWILKNCFGKPEYINVYRYLDESALHPPKIHEVIYEEIFFIMRINPVIPRKFFATSIPFFSPEPQLVSVRVEFANGTSANITINKFLNESTNRIEIFRSNKMAMILKDKCEIKIIQKNPSATESIPYLNNQCSFEDGLKLFKHHLTSGSFKTNSFENGIAAHRFAAQIIHQLAPSPEEICF